MQQRKIFHLKKPKIIYDNDNNNYIFYCQPCPFSTKWSFNFDRHINTHNDPISKLIQNATTNNSELISIQIKIKE